MHFLFPDDVRTPGTPEDFFAEQASALAAVGFTWSVVSSRALRTGSGLTGIPTGEQVVYRGWMLDGPGYERLVGAIEEAGDRPLTRSADYLATHHLPNWYPLIAELTPETRFYSADADLQAALTALGWDAFFVKDYVKSLKTGSGSLVHDPREVGRVVAELADVRDGIEGGVCVRRVEEFVPGTETRYFVIDGTGYAPDGGPVPDVVADCAARIGSPFFSVDVARRSDGVQRVVEVGDGQVSDVVGWSSASFAAMWRAAVNRRLHDGSARQDRPPI